MMSNVCQNYAHRFPSFGSDRTKNADPKTIHRSRVWLDSHAVALRSDPTALPTLGDGPARDVTASYLPIVASNSAVAATTCCCCSSRLIVAVPSPGCGPYHPICAWLPPSMGT